MKQLIFILCISLSLWSCNDDDLNISEIKYSSIAQGNLSGNSEEGISQSNLVIKTTDAWNNLMAQMDSVNDNTTSNFTETDIDFEQYQIIAVFDHIYGNGGHSIEITSVIKEKNKIIVKIERLQNGDDTLVMTQPFHIVKIPKSDLEIIFK